MANVKISELSSSATLSDSALFAAVSGSQTVQISGSTFRANLTDPHYLQRDGSTPLSGNLNMGGNAVTNVGNVDGVDISSHKTRHSASGADPIKPNEINAVFSTMNVNAVTGDYTLSGSDVNNLVDADTDTAGGNISIIIPDSFPTGSVFTVSKKGTGGDVQMSGSGTTSLRGSDTLNLENAMASIIMVETGSALLVGDLS